MLAEGLYSLTGTAPHPIRTNSVPCVTPSRRRSRDLTLLGLEAVGFVEVSPGKPCNVDHVPLGDQLPSLANYRAS